MKINLDENLASPHRRLVEDAGHDVADVHDENLVGASDDLLWSHVSAEGRFLITLDTDFSDLRHFPRGNEGNLAALAGCLAVADELRIRVRRQ